jgi:site-specific DNA-methyltransferase (cytosine-N4-specific)
LIYATASEWTLHVGDARDVLALMPEGYADCIVTSPPYWAKRDYGVAGQYGLEPDPDAYIATLRSLFREAHRVLASDGTCSLNLGDSYSAGSASASGLHAYLGPGLAGRHSPGMTTKNLLGLPWRVALALQDDGWIIRNAIVWHKPNAMPESVRDRLNCRYELIFLLVRSRRYWFDLDPIRVPHASTQARCAAASRPGSSPHRPGSPPCGRHPGDASHSGSRPGGASGSGNRLKYSSQTREVIAARRYGDGRSGRRHPNGRNPGDAPLTALLVRDLGSLSRLTFPGAPQWSWGGALWIFVSRCRRAWLDCLGWVRCDLGRGRCCRTCWSLKTAMRSSRSASSCGIWR